MLTQYMDMLKAGVCVFRESPPPCLCSGALPHPLNSQEALEKGSQTLSSCFDMTLGHVRTC